MSLVLRAASRLLEYVDAHALRHRAFDHRAVARGTEAIVVELHGHAPAPSLFASQKSITSRKPSCS